VFPYSLRAQKTNTYWEIDYAKGSILEHSQLVTYLFKEHPSLLSIGWFKTASNKSVWKERYNYPDWGFVLIHQDFHNKVLGTSTGLNYTTTHYLFNRNNKHQLNIQLGFGGGYNSNPLDLEKNLSNIVMSTHLLFTQHIKINYSYPNLFEKIGINMGLSFSHFSNGAIKKPNLGLNTVFLNIGLNYHDKKENILYEKTKNKEKIDKQPIHFSMNIGFGFHESFPNMGTKPIYYLSTRLSKRVTYKTGILFGFDFFNSQSIKELAVYNSVNDIDNTNSKVKDHKQIGVFFGKETYFDKLSLDVKMGYYLYRPVLGKTPIYETISFKRYFTEQKKSAISLNLKTHYFEAEHITIGYHHQIF
jgi:hypothetical protein